METASRSQPLVTCPFMKNGPGQTFKSPWHVKFMCDLFLFLWDRSEVRGHQWWKFASVTPLPEADCCTSKQPNNQNLRDGEKTDKTCAVTCMAMAVVSWIALCVSLDYKICVQNLTSRRHVTAPTGRLPIDHAGP